MTKKIVGILIVALLLLLPLQRARAMSYTWTGTDLFNQWDKPLGTTAYTGLLNCIIIWNTFTNNGWANASYWDGNAPLLCADTQARPAVEIWLKSSVPALPAQDSNGPLSNYDTNYTNTITVVTDNSVDSKFVTVWTDNTGQGASVQSSTTTSNTISVTINNYYMPTFRVRVTILDPGIGAEPIQPEFSITSITQVQTIKPTPTTTATNFPTLTPAPSATLLPDVTPPTRAASMTPIPTNISTRSSPKMTAYPTVDTCRPENMAIACGPLGIFPTLDLPVLNLPSPTPVQPFNTPTPNRITATPSFTPTFTATNIAASITPVGTPAPIAIGGGIDTSAILSLSNFMRDTLATFVPVQDLELSINGTPTGLGRAAAQIGALIGQPIKLFRSLGGSDFNKGIGIIDFGVLLLAFVILSEAFFFVLPLLLTIIRIVLAAISAFKPI